MARHNNHCQIWRGHLVKLDTPVFRLGYFCVLVKMNNYYDRDLLKEVLFHNRPQFVTSLTNVVQKKLDNWRYKNGKAPSTIAIEYLFEPPFVFNATVFLSEIRGN